MEFKKDIINIASGLFFIALIIGSMFSLNLVRYGYFMIIAFSLLMFHFFGSVLKNNIEKKQFGKFTGAIGFIGVFLIFLFFGIQSPQIPFKNYLLIAGIAIIIYGLVGLNKKS